MAEQSSIRRAGIHHSSAEKWLDWRKVTNVFRKDYKGIEGWGNVKHEASVVPETEDVAFIATVEENRAARLIPFI